MLLPCIASNEKEVERSLSAIKHVEYESTGRWFEAYVLRKHSDASVSACEVSTQLEEDTNEDIDISDEQLSKDEMVFMIGLDEKLAKYQDHYRVLRLTDKRGTATDADVKNAYRKMVLLYHPDKRRADAPEIPGLNMQNYFTCITRAYESLSTVAGRRAFDSVDDTHDDSIPSSFNSSSGKNFYDVFRDVFKSNSRWSEIIPVPQLGDENTPLEEVNKFYDFWFNFQSWREFSMKDKENLDEAECREEKRWMERQNKQSRQKAKKEEMQRIRSLVDNAFQNDPRLKKYQEEQKRKKAEEKKLKEEAAKKKEEERLQKLKEEKELKLKLEQEAKEKADKEKKEREKQKKAVARDRKVVRQFVKDKNFFTDDQIQGLDILEKTLANLSLDNLQELKENATADGLDNFKNLYLKHSGSILSDLEAKQESAKAAALAQKKAKAPTISNSTDQNWNDVELQLLVKAMTVYPIGSVNRWAVIAEYINEHSGSEKLKTGKHVISKVKKLQKLDADAKEEVTKNAFQELTAKTEAKLTAAQPVNDEITVKDTVNTDKPTASVEAEATAPKAPEKAVWSPDEQKLLEEALKKFPASVGAERWDLISKHVSTRTKKECMKRYKELVEMIKAKKASSS